ncbi:MAG TPA: FAD-dependent oxidoreductase [Caldimonas sp.]|jgi:D-amino-acid dehydrogenase|nr:FAD-dependent oxidoreductase [Caldimonas sp.]HEX2542792.1 FAD-dependent oxidoreductase [Caldimonas sp.]
MRVAVIGAGVIGVTTAYELGIDGHEVTVFEQRSTVAAEASFANAGLVAPGYVAPWAAPGMPRKVLSHLLAAHAPVRVGARLDGATIGWLWRWWRACKPATYRANRARMHRLAHFSRDRLRMLTTGLHLDFERAQGFLVLLRTPRDLALAEPGIRALTELGAAPAVIDAAACRVIEPGLNPAMPLHAGVYSKDDEVGNCREFAHLLRREAERSGVRFRFHSRVERIAPGACPRLKVVPTPEASETAASPASTAAAASTAAWPSTADASAVPFEEAFDAVVVCAAVASRALLRPLGVRLPLLAVHGYSVTAPLRHDDQHLHLEPRAALMDERYKVAISRMGNRVRVAGSAEIGAASKAQSDRAFVTLDKVLDDWFPGISRREAAQRWKGARPMLPDGPPLLGASGAEGVWLNLGHGGSGWALSCGSARLLADAIAGRKTPIEIDGLGIARLGS